MGVCNVTPDSFSDGGRYLGAEAARARVDELLAEGADLVDVGGESTRPGAAPVAAKEQLARTLEVVRYAAERGACVSIDTASPEVAAACLDAGACAVNDVSCLRDAELARVAAASGAALVLMHARGTQAEMRGYGAVPDDAYGDVVDDVLREWGDAAGRATAAGLPREALLMDPGLGFAKNAPPQPGAPAPHGRPRGPPRRPGGRRREPKVLPRVGRPRRDARRAHRSLHRRRSARRLEGGRRRARPRRARHASGRRPRAPPRAGGPCK